MQTKTYSTDGKYVMIVCVIEMWMVVFVFERERKCFISGQSHEAICTDASLFAYTRQFNVCG